MESSIRISSIWVSSIMESIRISKRKSMYNRGNRSSCYNSKRLRCSNDMDWGSFLLSSKTTGSSVLKSSLERSFSSSNFFYIIQSSNSKNKYQLKHFNCLTKESSE